MDVILIFVAVALAGDMSAFGTTPDVTAMKVVAFALISASALYLAGLEVRSTMDRSHQW